MRHYDIVIAGGGLSGIICALALANKTKKTIALLDNKKLATTTIDNNALLVLNNSSIKALIDMNLEQLIQDRVHAIKRCNISAQKHFGRIRINAEDMGVDVLGRSILLQDLWHSAYNTLLDTNTIHIIDEAAITNVCASVESMRQIQFLRGAEAQSIQTPLLIAADGTHSTVRSSSNIAVKKNSLAYSSIVMPIRTNQEENTAWQRFTLPGSIAYIPGSRHTAAIIMTLPSKQAIARYTLNTKQMLSIAKSDLGSLGNICVEVIGKPKLFHIQI